ncbi:MAG TPA: hypothetical protein PLW61_05795 [Caldisericia bacterium]|nr:hypothetical protein [Caldisericia bacterium]
MIEKKTWREFLENYDFSNWELGFIDINVDKMYDDKCIIKKFNTNVIDFYIVFSWDYRKMRYVAWCECFFSLEEAEKFVKGDII